RQGVWSYFYGSSNFGLGYWFFDMKKRKYIAPSSILKPEFSRIGNNTKAADRTSPEAPQQPLGEGTATESADAGVPPPEAGVAAGVASP
ncbi:MAG: hypothetical protein ACKN9U_03715, partial [Pirellulaceae bacterium]